MNRFEKCADELLADVERGELSLRDAVVGHGRVMFEEGAKAATDYIASGISDVTDEVMSQAEEEQTS